MYQVLYRKYRPRVFADVYGQDHVVSTLRHEISEGRVSHAYLFTGSRGTGKTTCAKILAKAVNCENPQNGEPCNECEVCKGLDNGSIFDVVEIDAASNNGVANIRELREETNYTPSRGKYRVYIIDEVHMLSIGAFNALLKTLEEPPAHVVFILATTEVHKLPATILSRCQRFDFKRIPPEVMAIRLSQVAKAESFELDDDAAVLIARIADGALRDALSILDQCASRSSKITSTLVSEVAGLAGRESIYELSQALCEKNSTKALGIIDNLYSNSYDMERLCSEMISHFRNLMMVKTVKNSRELIICTDDEYKTISERAKNFSLEGIIYILDLFQQTLQSIKQGSSARIEAEMTFVKLCEPQLEQSTSALLERISALERTVRNGVVSAPVKVQETVASSPVVNTDERVDEPVERNEIEVQPDDNSSQQSAPSEPTLESSTADVNNEPEESKPQAPVQTEFTQWDDVMELLYKSDIAIYGVLSGAKGFIRDEYFLIDSPNPTFREFIKIPTHSKAIKKALFDVTGKAFKLGLFKKTEQKTQQRDPLEDLINKAQQNNIKINFE